jgi:hypothetical protein
MLNNESANEDPYFGQHLPFLLMFIGGPRIGNSPSSNRPPANQPTFC